MSHSHSPAGGGPSADVSVRVAWADDAPGDRRRWVGAWPSSTPAAAGRGAADDVDAVAEQWRQALARPADARNRVLVALERNRVVGFALTSAAADPDCDPVADGELAEVTLDPAERAKGHGSRLLQAAVDTLAADRFTRAVTWVNAGDDALRTFLTDAGWAPDTAHRELDLDGTGTTTVKQVRLHGDRLTSSLTGAA